MYIYGRRGRKSRIKSHCERGKDKMINIVVLVIVLIALPLLLLPAVRKRVIRILNRFFEIKKKDGRAQEEQKEDTAESIKPQSQGQDTAEKKKWLDQLDALEKEKNRSERNRLCMGVLRDCITVMQYLTGITAFLERGGKMNLQQEEIFLMGRVVEKSRDILKKTDRLKDQLSGFHEGADRKKYEQMDAEQLKNAYVQLRKAVETGGGEGIGSEAVISELGKQNFIESLAGLNSAETADWRLLREKAAQAAGIFEKQGISFLFRNDERVKQYGLWEEFNEGNSIDIDIPGVFIRSERSGEMHLLEGYIGIYTENQKG